MSIPSSLPRRSALLALISAGLAPLVVACVDDDPTEAPTSLAAETGLAADGDPLADGGWEPATEEADTPTAALESPTDERLRLTISTKSSLRPNMAVELTIKGVARAAIDGGEVVLALPTRAIMDHALDTGVPAVPAKARWDLPAIAKGGMWSRTYSVPGEAAGYYRVLVNAYTHGPDGGPWLFNDVSRSAWMFVDETDGQLTRFFEDLIFPEGVDPVAGPRRRIGGRATGSGSRPDKDKTSWHPDSVFVQVLYYNSWRDGFKPAVGMGLGGWEYARGENRRNPQNAYVPEDGIVAFGCPPEGWYLLGRGWLPQTRYVRGKSQEVLDLWLADRSDCGRLKTVGVEPDWYIPWRHLDVGAKKLSYHLGKWRTYPVKWNVNFSEDARSRYNPFTDKITLRANFTLEDRSLWTASHEYAHALHNKALGGLWWSNFACFSHQLHEPSSVRCALQEGFADYAGTIGSDGYYEECFEHFGDPTKVPVRDSVPGWRRCRLEADHGQKPKIEGHVAALFLDLTDDTEEKGDYTEYPGSYIGVLFKTCKTQSKYWKVKKWWKRTNVSNIVWCLENYIEPAYHESDSVFEDIRTPVDVREGATEPPGWSRGHIRSTWLHNLN